MCIASPGDGQEILAAAHRRALLHAERGPRLGRGLRDHLENPTEGLSRDDEELWAYVTRLMMRAEREPATPEAMELSRLELDLARVDDQIQAAEGNGGEPPVELQRHRAELTDRIARAHS